MKVLLVGTYNSWNKGDAAMQLTCSTRLAAHEPPIEVTIASPFPERDRDLYSAAEVVRCRRRQAFGSLLQLAAAVGWRALRHLSGRAADRLLWSDELKAYRSADLVVDLSGDMLTDVHGPHVAISHYLALVLARLLAKPYVICAQSIGPFGWSRRFAVWLLRGAQWITVREDISLRALADLEVGDHVQRTADLAFLMDPAPATATTAVLGRASVDEHAELLIGVSVSGLVAGANARARKDRDTEFFEESVARALDAVASRHDAEIMLVPQVTGPAESKDDRQISRRVAAHMQHAARVVEDDLDPPMLKAVIARSDIFVGCRMHANIAAISSCVPTTAMSYSHKSDGIMDSVGLGDRVLAAADVDAASLEHFVERLLDDRAEVHAQLEQIMPSVRAASERNFELIDESLGFDR